MEQKIEDDLEVTTHSLCTISNMKRKRERNSRLPVLIVIGLKGVKIMTKDINELEEECMWIETALKDPESVEHKIYLSNAPRKDLITRWAENLEKLQEAGKYTHDINTISSFISDKFRTWNMFGAVHYVRHTLDYKYKQEKHNTSHHSELDEGGFHNRQDSSNLLSFEAKNTNTLLISFMLHTIEALKSNIDRLRKDVMLESKIPLVESEQLFLNWGHILKRHQEAWDGRHKVLTANQHLMMYALSQFSLNHSYIEYMKYVREDMKLTEKQASKMSRLQTNKIDKLFDPKNFLEAKELGFYGQQCGTCGSWRTECRWNQDIGKDQLYCFEIHDDKDKPQFTQIKTMKIQEVPLVIETGGK